MSLALLLLAIAAPAHAWTLEWEPVGQTAAGGSSQAEIAAIGGVPYAAWVDGGHVIVSRLASDGTWQAVGGAVNHDPSKAASHPHLADIDGTPWIAWVEADANGTAQMRVARFTAGAWHEVVGGDRPLNRTADSPGSGALFSAYEGRLVSFGGHVYVAFREDNGVDVSAYVSRLSDDGSAWQAVGTVPLGGSARGSIDIAASGGHLSVGYDALPGGVYVSRLNASGTGWTLVGGSLAGAMPDGRFKALSDADGALEVLWGKAGSSVQLSKLAPGDTWVRLTSDSDIPGIPGGVTQASGLPYVASVGTDELAHVTFFTGRRWEQAPDPSTEVAPATPPSLTTVGDDPYVGYARGADECVARLENEADSSQDDDSCGPAFGTPVASPPAQSNGGDSSESPGVPSQPGGSDPARCHVPRLKGKTRAAARRALAHSHCAVGRVTRRSSRKVGHGRVIATTPSAGAWLARRARVRLVVAR